MQIKGILIMQEHPQSYQKLHSFSRRPCLTQLTSYLTLLTTNLIFWVLIQPHFVNQKHRFLMIVAYSMSLVVLLIAGTITSLLDPSDPLLKEQCDNEHSIHFKFNTQKYLYCEHCKYYVLPTSRHCKQCDRCITKFDHHCIWINHCIGEINYKAFFAMICAAFVHLLLFLASLGLLWAENTWKLYLSEIIVTWVLGVVVIVFVVLLLGLIVLHSYLIHNKMTTFDYILSKKTQQQRLKYTNIIRVKIEEIKEQEVPFEMQRSGKHHSNVKTENDLPPPSAFQSVSHTMSEDKSETPSFECFKEKRGSGHLRTLNPSNFESIVALKSQEEENVSKVLTMHHSLKILVGNSIKIKSRKDTMQESSSKSSSNSSYSKGTNIKINILRAEDVVYHTRQEQKPKLFEQM